MSMEICVLSDRRLASIAAWQAAIDAHGFSLRLSPEASFEALGGHLPSQRGDDRIGGFECYHDPVREIFEGSPRVDFGRPWTYALSFRWGGNLAACASAWMAAAAYAEAVDGVVFDPQEGEIVAPARALEIAREIERELPRLEAEMERWSAERS